MPSLIRRPKGRGNRMVKYGGIRKAKLDKGWSRIICCASGPSLVRTPGQVDMVRRAMPGWRVIVINTTYQLLPSADVLYAGDRAWWLEHINKVRERFPGECWTVNRSVAHQLELCHVNKSNEPGLSPVHGRVHTGGNSGYAAIGLAYLFGAREILLVGYDFQDTGGMSHWHGDHPASLNQERPFQGWIDRMPPLIEGLQYEGVHVTNCTTETAIPETVIPRGDLAQCLSSSAVPSLL